MKKVIIKSIFTLLFIFNAESLFSDWKNSISFSSNYDENPFHYSTSETLNINNTALNFGYKDQESGFAANYMLSYSLIPKLSNSQLTDNIFNFKYTKEFGEEYDNDFVLAAQYANKINTGDLSLYNNNLFLISSSISNNLTESIQINYGYDGAFKNYYNNIDFSFLEHILYFGFKSYFETNTSISGELDYGNKTFTNKLFSFSGKGKNSTSTSQSLNQVMASIKIGQSIFERTGLSLNYSQSWNLSSSLNDAINFNPETIFEKDIYDDSYSYQSKDITLTLTQQFENNFKAQAFGYYSIKDYIYKFDFYEEPVLANRADILKGFGITLEKTFKDVLFFSSTKLNFNYIYSINSSNESLFNFSSNYLNLGLKFNF